MKPCVFCKIVRKEIASHIVYEDDLVLCFLDTDPIHTGHILIIPKKHWVDIDEIDDQSLIRIIKLAQYATIVIKQVYHPDGYTMMQNGGSFNDIGHYHLHLFPRYTADQFTWVCNSLESDTQPETVAKQLKHSLLV